MDALENMPAVVLSGMRQSGKSMLLLHLPVKKDFVYKTFDGLNTLEATLRKTSGKVGNRLTGLNLKNMVPGRFEDILFSFAERM